ncbi:DMT family transporter [Hahella ganghwensis]|uniref:DMT family transporter n=1 Tax=Hahella ganghwensis TaxID=286420 RepID=UPI0003A902D4|nr:DMT family transporter [Hahella ganghwensis]
MTDERARIGQGIAMGVLAALIWGIWPVVSRLGVQQTLTAYDVAAIRFAVAGVIFLPWVIKLGLGGLSWKQALILTTGAGAPYVLISVGGLTLAPASHGGVIISGGTFLFSTLGSILLLGDRPTRHRWAGFTLILLGILSIGYRSITTSSESLADAWMGDLLFVVSGFLWASYTLNSKRFNVSPVMGAAIVSVLSMVFYVPGYLAFGDPQILEASWQELITQGVFQGVLAAALALVCYTKSISILGAAQAAVFVSLAPGLAVLFGDWILNEPPSYAEYAGVSFVILGLLTSLGLFRLRKTTTGVLADS